jgi:hypothetical protein
MDAEKEAGGGGRSQESDPDILSLVAALIGRYSLVATFDLDDPRRQFRIEDVEFFQCAYGTESRVSGDHGVATPGPEL